MSTNKELFEQQMNTLADTINSKTGMVGKKTIDEMLTTAEDNIVNFEHLYTKIIDDSEYLVNPTTFEPYFVYTDSSQLTLEKFLEIAAQICVDYNGSFILCDNTTPYEFGYIVFENLKTVYLEKDDSKVGTVIMTSSEFNTMKFFHSGDFYCCASDNSGLILNISKQEERE